MTGGSPVRARVRGTLAALCWAALLGCAPAQSGPAAELANPGFDGGGGAVPTGWSLDPAAKEKGALALVNGAPGASGPALELRPNARNGGDKPLGVGQLLDASRYRGRSLEVRARLGAAGGAGAVLGVHALGASGSLAQVQITQDESAGSLRDLRGSLKVPAGAQHLVVYAIATGTSGRALFDSVSLAPAVTVAQAADVGSAAEVTIDTRQFVRDIPPTVYGTNAEWIFDGQGLWSRATNSLDANAVRLGREVAPSIIRFPGGVFSDTYHWRDGTGPIAERRTTAHYPGGPQSQHVLGSQEIAEYARGVGAELMLTVNAGTGTPQEAADWVRYTREQMRTPVRLWEVGNELYMKGDLSGAHMTADQYASRYLSFAGAMRSVDPSIRIGAIGGLNYGNYRFIADNSWTEKVLRTAAGQIDFLAVHNAYAPVVMGPTPPGDPRLVYQAMLAAPQQIEANLRDVSALLARYETQQRPISIAVTEWGPMFHVLPSSPWVDHVKTMGSALFVAGTLNAFLRTPRLETANFFKLADQGFMGWLGRRDGQWVHTAPGMTFSLYRRTLGRRLVQARVVSPTFSTPGVGVVSPSGTVPVVDAVATHDDGLLRVMLVNRGEQPITVQLRLAGVAGVAGATVQTLSAEALDAHTGSQLPRIPGLQWAAQVELARFNRGAPGEIKLTEQRLGPSPAAGADTVVSVTLPPISVQALKFDRLASALAKK